MNRKEASWLTPIIRKHATQQQEASMYQSILDTELSLFTKIVLMVLMVMRITELINPGIVQTVMGWLLERLV